MASARGGIPTETVLEVLRQRSKEYSDVKRRELAEMVVARAIADPRVGTPAILAISLSGSSNPDLRGTPDSDALGRLIQIHQGALSADERGYALTNLIDQTKPARALVYLRQVATSGNELDAWIAVGEIARLAFGVQTSRAEPDERRQAQSLLREFYDGNLVKGRAVNDLCDLAAQQKWPKSPRCRGRM